MIWTSWFKLGWPGQAFLDETWVSCCGLAARAQSIFFGMPRSWGQHVVESRTGADVDKDGSLIAVGEWAEEGGGGRRRAGGRDQRGAVCGPAP